MSDKLCACGCGELLPEGIGSFQRPIRYVDGHQRAGVTPDGMSLNLGSTERAIYGAIVSVRRLDTDERRTLALTRVSPTEAVRAAVASLRTWRDAGEPWVVCCISTPVTIYRDLQASRKRLTAPRGSSETLDLPERTMLTRAGALDLIDPALDSPLPDARVEGRTRR